MLALHMQGPGFAPQALKTSFLSLAQKFSMSSHSLGIKDLSTHFHTTGPALLQGPSSILTVPAASNLFLQRSDPPPFLPPSFRVLLNVTFSDCPT